METSTEREYKTPIYTRNARMAYYYRQKAKDPEYLNVMNEKNKVRQMAKRQALRDMNNEITTIMSIRW